VMELLVADQPARATSHDPDSKFWHWAETTGVTESRFPAAERWDPYGVISRLRLILVPDAERSPNSSLGL
jgi:hypothetical protein